MGRLPFSCVPTVRVVPIYRHEGPYEPRGVPVSVGMVRTNPPRRYIDDGPSLQIPKNINCSIMEQLIFFATCRTCSGVYRCGCVWSHALPNPDGKDHRPPATFARERKGTFRANRTDLPNPGGTGTDPERRNTTTKRKKTKNKKERHKKKEQRQEEKKPTLTQETQQEQEHSNNIPKPKPKHKKKHDGRLAPGCAETAVNGGFPTKLGSVLGV